MRKNNVWKQALALVLSATLVLGNVSPVSAATGDAGTGEGAANQEQQVTSYDAIEFKADGEMVSSGDGYEESGIKFNNEGVEIVDAPILTPDEGDEKGGDGGHGKVFKFSTGTQKIYNDPESIPTTESTTGVSFLTSVEGALAGYDFSNGVSFSFDIYPDQQATDWNYLFACGQFEADADKQFTSKAVKNTVTGTMGFTAAFDSEKKRQETGGNSWMAYFPHEYWLDADRGGYRWNYFVNDTDAPEGDTVADHIHKWYTLKYSYTAEGLTISINGKPIISYFDNKGYVEDILQNMNKGQIRLGKGILTTLEGYQGLMDNIKIEPIAPHQHTFLSGDDGTRVEPSCTENGYIDRGQCTGCGNIVKEVIPALGHNYEELVDKTEATCTRAGYEAHYECERCGQWAVADETVEGGKKEVESDEIKIASLGHDYETTITKATAENDGTIVETCKREGCSGTGHTKTTIIPKASDITLSATEFTYNGKAFEPTVTVKDSEGTKISADNYDVAYSNNINVGTATVKITFKGNNYQGTVTKTFTIKAASVNPPAASLTLEKSSVTLYTGKASKTATVKVKTVTGASKTVTWKSDNPKIAKVDSKTGKITAVKAGTTNVKATANGITKSVKVTVKNPTITLKSGKKKFTKKTVTVKRKKSTTLTVSVSPSKSGFALGKLTAKQKKIATVTLSKKGKLVIKGKKKGSFKIKITSGKATKTLTIKVK